MKSQQNQNIFQKIKVDKIGVGNELPEILKTQLATPLYLPVQSYSQLYLSGRWSIRGSNWLDPAQALNYFLDDILTYIQTNKHTNL